MSRIFTQHCDPAHWCEVDREGNIIRCTPGLIHRLKNSEEAELSEDVKISGTEAEMTEDDYRRLFNLARTSASILDEVPELQALKGKAFCEMTMEEKGDHIDLLTKAIRKLKVFKNSAALARQDEMMNLGFAERERIKEHDRKYKPKPVKDPETGKVKASPRTAEEKLIEGLTKMLGSEEAARAYLLKQRGQ